MEDPVREEGTHSLCCSALENRAQISSMKTGAAQQWYAACLALLIGAACQGNSLFRAVDSDDVETEFEKVKRISPVPAAPVNDLDAFRSSGIAVQDRPGEYSCRRARRKSPQLITPIFIILLPCLGNPCFVQSAQCVRLRCSIDELLLHESDSVWPVGHCVDVCLGARRPHAKNCQSA